MIKGRYSCCHLAILLIVVWISSGLILTAYGLNSKAGRTFTFTTTSEDARKYAAQTIQMIENFQFGESLNSTARKAVEADPDFAFGHYLVGVTSFPPPKGRPHIEKAVELSKKASDAERRYIEAMGLLRSQQQDKAIQMLAQLSIEYPGERMVFMSLGQAYLMKGNLEQARATFEKAMKLDSKSSRVHAFLGNYYLLKENYAKARSLYKKAISNTAKGSAAPAPYYGLAFSYVYQGDIPTALKVLTDYRELYTKAGGIPNLPPVFLWNSIARLQLENGNPQEAIKTYEEGYKTVPGSSLNDEDKMVWLGRLHHGRGRAMAKMGKYEEAWKEADQIKKMIDEAGDKGKQYIPAYHYIAGYLKLESKDYASAIEHLKQADQRDDFHKLLLARAYEKTGDESNAQRIYREVLQSTQVNMERALAYPEAKKKLKKN
jgi:tetratricopeptide (TPR) repeat protein